MGLIGSLWDGATSAVNTVGKGLSTAGQAVTGAGQWAQQKVGDGVSWVDAHTDGLVNSFEHSAVGDNAVGHFVGDTVRNQVHLDGGIVKGVTGAATGLVDAAGLGLQANGAVAQYATDGNYRDKTNKAVSNIIDNIKADPLAIPRNVASNVKQAWDKDPFDTAGQAIGMVGTAVATAGLGTAGDVGNAARGAEGIQALGTAGRTAEVASGAAPAAEEATTLARGAGEATTAAPEAATTAAPEAVAPAAPEAAAPAPEAAAPAKAAAAAGEPGSATAPVEKFSDYIFKDGATHGKDRVFKSLGYGKEDSADLARMWEQQGAAKFANGDYTLGKLDQYGQRINIGIDVPGIGPAAGKSSQMTSGWMIQPGGGIKLNTPFSGFVK